MWLIAGLGNPGRRYKGTRHNIGFDVADELANAAGVSFRRSWRFPAEWAEAEEEGNRLLIVKPRTYMNRSGQAIGPILRRKGLALSKLIVIVDDTDLECGRLRIRRRGSAGGHNGLKSIIAATGSDDFIRVRIGVGGRTGSRGQVEHVLSGFAAEEREQIEDSVKIASEAVWCIASSGVDYAMNRYNF